MVIKAYKENCAYAIKTFVSAQHIPAAEIQRRLFYYEAHILKLIGHSRIPKYVEIFSFQHNEYMVQEYVRGDPLSNMILKGYLFSEAEIVKLIVQLLEILCYLHRQYIVHRDLRLGNLILNDGQLYLIDFGLARKFQFISDMISLPDPVPRNASPAYLALRRDIAPRSDVFGVGIVAIDLMSNWFPGDASDDLAEYPISIEFKDFLKKLLSRRDGFTTAFEALHYLKNNLGITSDFHLR